MLQTHTPTGQQMPHVTLCLDTPGKVCSVATCQQQPPLALQHLPPVLLLWPCLHVHLMQGPRVLQPTLLPVTLLPTLRIGHSKHMQLPQLQFMGGMCHLYHHTMHHLRILTLARARTIPHRPAPLRSVPPRHMQPLDHIQALDRKRLGIGILSTTLTLNKE